MAVSTLPGLNVHRRIERAPVNPLDKSTVVSIYPIPIDEHKPTLQPGRFMIPAASYEKPEMLVVGSSSWWREISDEQPLLEIPVSSIQVADSIVRDYCVGVLQCDMETAMPGLFFVPGVIASISELKSKHSLLLEKANAKQRSWFQLLVKMADILWSRTQGNPLSISDNMRIAARQLGIEGKDWMRQFQHVEMVRCIACGVMNQSTVVVCPNCKVVIDKEQFEKLGLKFAQ